MTVVVTDRQPWSHVLLTVNGEPALLQGWEEQPLLNTWTWSWNFAMPASASPEVLFYVDCLTGCRTRGRLVLAASEQEVVEAADDLRATKLCTVMADPERNWHNRSGWVVDITYMKLADDRQDSYWSVDALAARVAAAARQGLRVLARKLDAHQQTLPPAQDYIALSDYLAFVRRLATDERLRTIDAFIVGSGPNANSSNQLAPDRLISPEWYARVFNGYGEPVDHQDNVVQTLRAVWPSANVLVGAVRPWIDDQNRARVAPIDAPWLNYMNTLVWAIDQSMINKSTAGYGNAGPDGFALHAPGRPDAPQFDPNQPANEPWLDFPRPDWNGAQAGFRVFQDWLAIVNAYPSTHGLPGYISATNTFADSASSPPAQNYPPGWLTSALAVVNQEPQLRALCWFLDLVPGDDQWDAFSLARHPGQLLYAAEEFDDLLQQK
ncbi:MAG TPA: hypothetical protein PL187_02300 [Caldilinea sp.]|nr:hypothetical protein [Caldilinea sp.]